MEMLIEMRMASGSGSRKKGITRVINDCTRTKECKTRINYGETDTRAEIDKFCDGLDLRTVIVASTAVNSTISTNKRPVCFQAQ